MDNKVKDFFDSLADKWNNDDNNYEIINSLLDKIGIKENSKVLDVACGIGVITPMLQKRSKALVKAIDLSPNMISKAKKLHNDNNLEFICGDFLEYKFDDKFDYIIIFNAYPHFLDVDKLALAAYNNLNQNGKLIIMHDISKDELNSHHMAKAMGVSRYFDEPKKEYRYFDKYFKLKEYIDNKDSYYMLLEK